MAQRVVFILNCVSYVSLTIWPGTFAVQLTDQLASSTSSQSQLDLVDVNMTGSHRLGDHSRLSRPAGSPFSDHGHDLEPPVTLDSRKSATNVDAISGERNKSKVDTDSGKKTVEIANPHPFKYILNNRDACRDEDIYLIVFVHTSPDHLKRRNVIRETWGSAHNYDVNVRVVFLIGRMTDDVEGRDVQGALLFEFDLYNDIIQEDFIDSYHNMTYKAIAGVRWIDEFCSHARWVLKTDDDVFVNMFNLIRYLQCLERRESAKKLFESGAHTSKHSNRSTLGLMPCLVWTWMSVMRSGKWKVDVATWPGDYYPTYCSGMAYVMSTDVAVALHRASYDVPFFWVDDVYLTGIVAQKIGLTAVRHVQFDSAYTVAEGQSVALERFTGLEWYRHVFWHYTSSPKNIINVFRSVWRSITRLERLNLSVVSNGPNQLCRSF